MGFIEVCDFFSGGINNQLCLINEDDLYCFIWHTEDNRVFGSEPSFYVNNVFRINWNNLSFVLIIFKVAFKMIEETNFLLQLRWIVFKFISFNNIFFVDSLNIIETLFCLGHHFSRIIKVYTIRSIIEQVSDAIFIRIINPFLNSNLWHFLFILFLFMSLFKHSLRFNSLNVLLLQRNSFEATWISLSMSESVLALHKHILACTLNRNIFDQIVVW